MRKTLFLAALMLPVMLFGQLGIGIKAGLNLCKRHQCLFYQQRSSKWFYGRIVPRPPIQRDRQFEDRATLFAPGL